MLLMIFRRVIRLVFLVIVTVIFADPNYALLMQCLQKPFKMLLVVYIFVLSIQGGLTIGAFGQCQWPI